MARRTGTAVPAAWVIHRSAGLVALGEFGTSRRESGQVGTWRGGLHPGPSRRQAPRGAFPGLVHVKVAAPTMLARAAAPGMAARGEGTIINVSGMIAFSGPGPLGHGPAASDEPALDAILALRVGRLRAR